MSKRRKPQPRPFSIKPPAAEDEQPFMELLALADPDAPEPYAAVRVLLARGPQGPLSHGITLLLAARKNGRIIGVLNVSVPEWVVTHPGIPDEGGRGLLARSIAHVHGIAVHPDHRRRGVARALLEQARKRLADAGHLLLSLEHGEDLADFYRRLGFTTVGQLTIHTPGPLLTQPPSPGLAIAVQPISGRVRLCQVPGTADPIVEGLVGPYRVPANAVFLPGRGLFTPQ
ncbi:GNAT family N-acetyltransferase [Kitasatospora sp. NPDC001527]|uniref:GNAT family N-acetyltransferase n=1 Tax=Kitasatospora sp. NPDC001527 TaxID=3154519 RepID=UPI00332D15E2